MELSLEATRIWRERSKTERAMFQRYVQVIWIGRDEFGEKPTVDFFSFHPAISPFPTVLWKRPTYCPISPPSSHLFSNKHTSWAVCHSKSSAETILAIHSHKCHTPKIPGVLRRTHPNLRQTNTVQTLCEDVVAVFDFFSLGSQTPSTTEVSIDSPGNPRTSRASQSWA